MASKQKQRKEQRIVVQRVDAMEQEIADNRTAIEALPLKIVNLIRGHGIHSSVFENDEDYFNFSDIAERATLKVAEQQIELEDAPKPMESRNTPEKKHKRQDWCYRLVVIRAVCIVAVDDLTTNRAYRNKTRRNKNWNSIVRAAKTVVIDDDSKQDLPLVGMTFVYAARLRMKVLELAQVAQVEHNSVASLYESRAASLLALLREIKTAHGNKFSANPNW